MKTPFAAFPLARELGPIDDAVPGSVEAGIAKLRHTRAIEPSAMPWLPQGADEWAYAIHERVDVAERMLVATNRRNEEYRNGTATRDNDVAEVGRAGGVLFTAEHATHTPRLIKDTGEFKMGFADVGTAGMAAVLAEDYGRGFIMTGRQTKPLADEFFAIKPYILEALPDHEGFISVHGCSSRPFVHPTDPVGIHAHLGLGIDPTDAERQHAEEIVRYGREELGLYVVIGNDQPYYVADATGKLRRNQDGTPYVSSLAAQKPYMTTNMVRRILAGQGQTTVRALQVEMAPLLLPTAVDGASRKDRKAEVIGVALGYQLLSKMAKLANAARANP